MQTANNWYQEGLLRSPGFDFTFVIGIAAIAIATGFLVTDRPELFAPILALDLWLLGYHHVISTYTRLIFDTESFREHKSLVLYLPVVVAAAVTALALSAGLWPLATIYLYWQWFHYTRQSEGISKAYGGKSAGKDLGNLRVARLAFYAVPLAGILHVSARNPADFLTMPLKTLPVPAWLLVAVDMLAVIAVVAWLGYQLRAWTRGRLALPYLLYMLSHFAIFSVAYIWLSNISYGWLTVNIWHNAQYILFVWLFNNRRFGGIVDDKHAVLSILSQNGRFPLYILACLTISTAVYFLIDHFGVEAVGTWIGVPTAVATIVIYQTINFHHYIVDSLIWKLRKNSLRSKLGLA
jgi:hypothetical protein